MSTEFIPEPETHLKFRDVIAEHVEIDPADGRLDYSQQTSLKALVPDSIAQFDVINLLEEEFNISLKDPELDPAKNLDDVFQLIAFKLGQIDEAPEFLQEAGVTPER